jgi:hypothetical protein
MTEENTIDVQATEVPDEPQVSIPEQSFAFPFTVTIGERELFCSGMTLRDYFAARVLNGIVAGLADNLAIDKAKEVAQVAYQFADAMMEVREPKR